MNNLIVDESTRESILSLDDFKNDKRAPTIKFSTTTVNNKVLKKRCNILVNQQSQSKNDRNSDSVSELSDDVESLTNSMFYESKYNWKEKMSKGKKNRSLKAQALLNGEKKKSKILNNMIFSHAELPQNRFYRGRQSLKSVIVGLPPDCNSTSTSVEFETLDINQTVKDIHNKFRKEDPLNTPVKTLPSVGTAEQLSSPLSMMSTNKFDFKPRTNHN